MYGGGKLQVKDLQSHDSKVMFALYYVYKGTPFHIIKKTLKDILREAEELLLFQTMTPDKEYNEPNFPQISIRPQVPHTSGYNKLPYPDAVEYNKDSKLQHDLILGTKP